MTTNRRFYCVDLLRFASVNLNHLTETVDGDRRNVLPPGGHDPVSVTRAHAALLSATNAGAGYTAFVADPCDEVEVDEPIAQVETDKVTIDVASPEAGVIKEYVAKEGDTVEPGTKEGDTVERFSKHICIVDDV